MPQSTQHIVARNIIVLLSAQLVTRIGGFITAILLTNYLDVDNFGRFNFLLAYATLFTPLCDLGIDLFIVRELSIHPEKRGVLAGTALSIRSALTLVCTLVITGSFYILYGSTSTIFPLILAAAGVATLRNAPGVFSGLFRANQHSTLDSMIQVAAKLFDLIAVLVALALHADIVLLFQILLVSALLQLGYSFHLAYRYCYLDGLSASYQCALSLFKGGLPFVLTSISVIIYFQIDAVMLSTLVGEHETGLYRAATNLVFSLTAFSAAVVVALFPMIAKKYSTNREEAVSLTSSAMFYSLLLGLPIATSATVLADPIIHFLYKDSFAASSSSLRILIWWLPVSFATNILGHALVAIGQQRKVLLVSAINAAFNIAANFYCIPRFGAVGASITTVITECIGLTVQTIIVRRCFGHVYQMNRLAKTMVAALLLLPLGLLSGTIHLGLIVGIGATVYILTLFIFRVLSKRDLEQLRTILSFQLPRSTASS